MKQIQPDLRVKIYSYGENDRYFIGVPSPYGYIRGIVSPFGLFIPEEIAKHLNQDAFYWAFANRNAIAQAVFNQICSRELSPCVRPFDP